VCLPQEETFGVEELYLSFFEYFSCSELGLRGIAGSPGDLCGDEGPYLLHVIDSGLEAVHTHLGMCVCVRAACVCVCVCVRCLCVKESTEPRRVAAK